MLQEILISLSGVPSPIWEKLKSGRKDADGLQEYLSQPEQAMLASLSRLSQLHIEVKRNANLISSKHPSLVCRAVGSSISNDALARFRRKVIEVEASILKGDASHVGGYQIVPLSTLVADFTPWTRRLEWLRTSTQFMKGTRTERSVSDCTAAAVLAYLERERHTGYEDVENLATQLLIVAQNVWMRSLSAWVLYGQLPFPENDDFMVTKSSDETQSGQCVLEIKNIPKFVSAQTADTILSIGNALRQLKMPDTASNSEISQRMPTSLLSSHLHKIKLLPYPLNPALLETTMSAINESISQHALSTLLPLAKVVGICRVVQDYMLLNRGEFAITLIENADTRVSVRQKAQSSSTRPVRKLGRVDDMALKDTELSSILSKTWSDLVALQGQNETEGDVFESAKKYLRLRTAFGASNGEDSIPLSTILPAPTLLQLEFFSDSPLAMFLSQQDRQKYARINAYLLSLRRSQMRLSSLWKLSSHRRCHPAPLAPPLSATEFGRRACKLRRDREDRRSRSMRPFWSSMNKSLFLLNEYESYLHGEVIRNSWTQFENWLNIDNDRLDSINGQDRSLLSSTNGQSIEADRSALSSMGRSIHQNAARDDPRTLARAHSIYLTTLSSGLLLHNTKLIQSLKSFVELLDHFIALFNRLSTIWEGLDLQEDDGVMDAFTNFAQDEKDLIAEMGRARENLEGLLEQIVKNLKDIEKEQDAGNLAGLAVGSTGDKQHGFVPWRPRTLDRLIMKLDFLYRKEEGSTEDLVDDLDYD